MTHLAFIDTTAVGAQGCGRPIFAYLVEQLRRYKIQACHLHYPESPDWTTDRDALTADILVIYNSTATERLSPAGKAVLHLAHRRASSPSPAPHRLAAPGTGACCALGTLWLSPPIPFHETESALSPALQRELGAIPPLLRYAANWVRRERHRRESLALAAIYADAPLFATAF